MDQLRLAGNTAKKLFAKLFVIVCAGCSHSTPVYLTNERPSAFKTAVISQAPNVSETIVVPNNAAWYVVAPPYGITDSWVASNMHISHEQAEDLIGASHAREQVLIASGRVDDVVTIEWLPLRYRTSAAWLIRPGEKLLISKAGNPPTSTSEESTSFLISRSSEN